MTYRIVIKGQVQGVGFRPFVYSEAARLGIKGTVSNNEEGVIIYASATDNDLQQFCKQLVTTPPRVARVKSHSVQQMEEREFNDFSIVPSEKNARLNLQLTPDFALCEDCEKELSDPANRRFNYPFTTCTYCGPRWAITNAFPFERDHTNMVSFPMCKDCVKEYGDPLDRRFHSQTNSCSHCGVQLALTDHSGKVLSRDPESICQKVPEILLQGKILAVKNTSGYLLCCDARSEDTVMELRRRKRRPTKPFAILYPFLSALEKDLSLHEDHRKELTSAERPIVLLPADGYKGDLAVRALAPGLRQLGVMIPYTALMSLMMRNIHFPVVATSGNIHGSPILSSEEEAVVALKEVADYFLHHTLEVTNPQDDSVVKYSEKTSQKIIFRRSRGYAPNYYGSLPVPPKKVIAMGAHLKSTIAFFPNDFLYLSQYLGNLDHMDVYQRFTDTVEFFVRVFETTPEVVLHDLHPAYASTQFALVRAREWEGEARGIQHHKAHFASVLGENELFRSPEPVLGVVWDGTGYGEDSAIWGGEFFGYKMGRMERLAHFEYFDWLAGDKMALEPRLSLFSLSGTAMTPVLEDKFTPEEMRIYGKVIQKNTLKTSSVGRIFDAVASLLGICDRNSYEGEAAILMENCLTGYDLNECHPYVDLGEDGKLPSFDLITRIHEDMLAGVPKDQIVRDFLFTLATIIFQVAERFNMNHIACSGGVFQNATLVDMVREIGKDNYKLYFNRALSPNDENIAFGQIAYYVHLNPES
ncbi:Hydrogenase maturation protein, carbamoyltransferase HypF [Muriicola jejuensis]|uniref:Carbamoyltransferase n=1 Tax=Muriicola jejuensis TaxID=504488 RepID=A0A6P0UH60_9FLAO|nr:carbamoyltransferase HypF [Muriicola jejuensis]NER09456.1 carbamoyltransferase HypF [Muriicola jejuensis]SMP08520.1 Hydrogenase maturation protein, carbamoyltransferase HypF [Muriicola jejuensis]